MYDKHSLPAETLNLPVDPFGDDFPYPDRALAGQLNSICALSPKAYWHLCITISTIQRKLLEDGTVQGFLRREPGRFQFYELDEGAYQSFSEYAGITPAIGRHFLVCHPSQGFLALLITKGSHITKRHFFHDARKSALLMEVFHKHIRYVDIRENRKPVRYPASEFEKGAS